MNSKSVRSAIFMFSLMLFSFLFVSGSSRLIGYTCDTVNSIPERVLGQIDASLTATTAPQPHSVDRTEHHSSVCKREISFKCFRIEPEMMVLSDANGNVLGHRSYIHEVYQAFVLNDGFV